MTIEVCSRILIALIILIVELKVRINKFQRFVRRLFEPVTQRENYDESFKGPSLGGIPSISLRLWQLRHIP
jgi:hypothetical protein